MSLMSRESSVAGLRGILRVWIKMAVEGIYGVTRIVGKSWPLLDCPLA